ncbi:MAG: hypothetical protein V4611_02195 [Patescibacteria group bacterium]
MTHHLGAVVYNPRFVIAHVDGSTPDGRFTTASRYRMTNMLIHERVWSEWNLNLEDVLGALEKTVEYVGGKTKYDCMVMPELTPFRKDGVDYVTPWLSAGASIQPYDLDPELDDTVAEHFYSLIYPREMADGNQPIKSESSEPGFGLRGLMFPIALTALSTSL